MEFIYAGIAAVVGLLAGFFTNRTITNNKANSLISEANNKVKTILDTAEKEGEQIKKDRILQSKEKYLQLKSQFNEGISNNSRTTLKIKASR